MTNRIEANGTRRFGAPPGLNTHSNGAPIMRKLTTVSALVLALAVFAGCDFLDPTSVTNPTVTEQDFIGLPNAAATWAHGVERQLASTVNQLVLNSEVGSDNLFNNRTLFNRTFDIPQMDPTDSNVLAMQASVHRLRAMANHGLTVVVPADQGASNETRARLHFHRGYAYLAGGEYFVGIPAEVDGPIVAPATHLNLALEDFAQARTLASDATLQAAATLALARTHYRLGNRSEAVAAAEEVRSSAPDFIRSVRYDATDGPTNTMENAVYTRGDNEFQPLPRLDFLFPKYYSAAGRANESPIIIAKGEEAFLILAEARLAQGDVAGARALLGELLDLVGQRPIASIDDTHQARGRRGGTWIYPNASNILVAASPDDEPRSGLVLDREDGPVQVPVVSGTSVTADMLAGATTEEALLELLYLMRQEVFVLEGRRMTDLGIRVPLSLTEAESNPNVEMGSPAMQALFPAWIPMDYGMNSFDYEDGDDLAVIHHNLNRALVQNRTSDLVLPFH